MNAIYYILHLNVNKKIQMNMKIKKVNILTRLR